MLITKTCKTRYTEQIETANRIALFLKKSCRNQTTKSSLKLKYIDKQD